eukprot:gb/GECH01013923.1/.p1 GENE.gb/GECH01013923.1/~~gb/GECH01013923.1/.p1  ORF type:complete len:435 (+),score=138.44 gb/GECH01013923.1/:1-1305(+)
MSWSTRYQTPLSNVFSTEQRIAKQLQVELALLKSLAEENRAPHEAYEVLKKAVDDGKVTAERVQELEAETHHDIMAMVVALSEQSKEYGGYVHLGATSQDINDTVTALQLKDAKKQLLEAIDDVRAELTRLSQEHRDVVCIGRTHGQHAVPTTIGFKFANFLYELSVARYYLNRSAVDIGKFAGAVGTCASLNSRDIQKKVLEELGLQVPPITTQVLSRLHYIDYLFAVSAVAAALEKLGKEIRNLQRTEINELGEGFAANQVGSSTMPQKRNPHKSERVCGLARMVRSQLQPQLETVALEHERDLTNSSVERMTLANGSVVTHYILREMKKILNALAVDQESVKRNLHLLNGDQLAERIMITVAEKLPGGRQEAHRLLKHYAHSSGVRSMIEDEKIQQYISKEEFEKLLEPETYTGCAGEIIDDVIKQYGVEY